MAARTFPASFDTAAKTVTAVVFAILAVLVWTAHILFMAPLFGLLFAVAYACSPRGYAIDEQGILIKRLIGNVRVPAAAIRGIRRGTRDDLKGAVRLWASGGVFGYYGLFQTARLGKCKWYVTNRANAVIVSTETQTMVLSPDDAESFLTAAEELHLPQTFGGMAELHTASSWHLSAKIGIGIALAAVGLFTLLNFYSPGLPDYTLSAGQLRIHDKFFPVTIPAATVDVLNIRVIDLAQHSEWRPAFRINGFANRNYQSGWFRLANGQTARLYRAGGNRLVLIPGKPGNQSVLYQAPDPDGLVRELRQRWPAP